MKKKNTISLLLLAFAFKIGAIHGQSKLDLEYLDNTAWVITCHDGENKYYKDIRVLIGTGKHLSELNDKYPSWAEVHVLLPVTYQYIAAEGLNPTYNEYTALSRTAKDKLIESIRADPEKYFDVPFPSFESITQEKITRKRRAFQHQLLYFEYHIQLLFVLKEVNTFYGHEAYVADALNTSRCQFKLLKELIGNNGFACRQEYLTLRSRALKELILHFKNNLSVQDYAAGLLSSLELPCSITKEALDNNHRNIIASITEILRGKPDKFGEYHTGLEFNQFDKEELERLGQIHIIRYKESTFEDIRFMNAVTFIPNKKLGNCLFYYDVEDKLVEPYWCSECREGFAVGDTVVIESGMANVPITYIGQVLKGKPAGDGTMYGRTSASSYFEKSGHYIEGGLEGLAVLDFSGSLFQGNIKRLVINCKKGQPDGEGYAFDTQGEYCATCYFKDGDFERCVHKIPKQWIENIKNIATIGSALAAYVYFKSYAKNLAEHSVKKASADPALNCQFSLEALDKTASVSDGNGGYKNIQLYNMHCEKLFSITAFPKYVYELRSNDGPQKAGWYSYDPGSFGADEYLGATAQEAANYRCMCNAE